MTDKLCFFCDKWGVKESFDLAGLKFVLGNGSSHSGFKFCDRCKQWIDARMKELEKKVYVLKQAAKEFIPKQIDVKPNYQDREPGEDG